MLPYNIYIRTRVKTPRKRGVSRKRERGGENGRREYLVVNRPRKAEKYTHVTNNNGPVMNKTIRCLKDGLMDHVQHTTTDAEFILRLDSRFHFGANECTVKKEILRKNGIHKSVVRE